MGLRWGIAILVLLAVWGMLIPSQAQPPTPTPDDVQRLTTDDIMATQQAVQPVEVTPRMQPLPGRRPSPEALESSPMLSFLLVVLVIAAVAAVVIVYRRSI